MRYGNARPGLRQSNLRHFLTLTRPKPEKTSKQQGESSPLSMQVSPAYAPALSAASRQPGPLRRSAPTTAPSGERRAEPSRAAAAAAPPRGDGAGSGAAPPRGRSGSWQRPAGSSLLPREPRGRSPPLVAARFDLVWLRLIWR